MVTDALPLTPNDPKSRMRRLWHSILSVYLKH